MVAVPWILDGMRVAGPCRDEQRGGHAAAPHAHSSSNEAISKWRINFGGDASLYDESSHYGEKHWELRNEVVHVSPLEKHVDVNLMCKVVVETSIVLNCIQLGACTHPEDSRLLTDVCGSSDLFFTAVFIGEFLYKLHKLRYTYFFSAWNRFDFFLLCVTLFDVILNVVEQDLEQGLQLRNFLILKILRLLRIIRILRVLQHKTEMRMVLEGMVASFQSMIWVAMMLGLLIYVTSIICVTFFREVPIEIAMDFSTIPQAMFALFTLAIVADWTDIVTPVASEYWWSPLFFVCFVICATFGIMNLIIGVITERTARVKECYRQFEVLRADGQRMENIKEIADIMFKECESHGDEDQPTITKSKMEDFTRSSEYGPIIEDLIKGVSLPAGYEVHDCHAMFDRDASGSITQKEFVQGMGRLIFSNEFQRSCVVQSSIADVMIEMKAIEGHLIERMDRMEHNMFAKLAPGAHVDAYRPSGVEVAQAAKVSEPIGFPAEGEGFVSAWRQSFQPAKEQSQPLKDLPSCRALLERLREPLAVLLANDLNSQAAMLSIGGESTHLLGATISSPDVASQEAVQQAAPSSVGRPRISPPTTLPKPLPMQAGICTDHAPTRSARSSTTAQSQDTEELLKQVKEMWEDSRFFRTPDCDGGSVV